MAEAIHKIFMRLYQIKNFFLKFFFSLLNLKQKKEIPFQAIKKIAIFSTTGLGDSLWATPALKVLKESYQEAHVTLVTSAVGKEVLLNNPDVDEVIVYSLFSFWQLFKILKKKQLDAIIIFHASQRKLFVLAKCLNPIFLIGTKGRNKDLDFIFTHLVLPQFHEHEIERRIRLVEAIHAKSTHLNKLSLHISQEERDEADFFLKTHGITKNDLLIGIHPGSKDPYKRWPKEYFEEVAKRIKAKHPVKIIFTGGMDEGELILHFKRLFPDSVGIFGQVSIRTLIAIIERMKCFLTNDTGPMHIGYALEIPTIGLFSPTNPKNCGPYNAKNSYALFVNRCCTPCLQRKCKDPFCLRQIKKQAVIDLMSNIIK
jgi:heptosyltransferase-2